MRDWGWSEKLRTEGSGGGEGVTKGGDKKFRGNGEPLRIEEGLQKVLEGPEKGKARVIHRNLEDSQEEGSF